MPKALIIGAGDGLSASLARLLAREGYAIALAARNIAKLDDQKKQINAQLMKSTDPAEALKLHNEVASLTSQLADAEERWLRLQEEVEDAEL